MRTKLEMSDIVVGDRLVLVDDYFLHHEFYNHECIVKEIFDGDIVKVTFVDDPRAATYDFFIFRFEKVFKKIEFELPEELFTV